MSEIALSSETISLLGRMEQASALGPTYLDLSGRPELSLATFESLARFFGSVHDGSKWWISELILQAEARFGESAYQIAEATGRSERTLQNWCWVASKVARSRRRERLNFTCHYLVASMEPAEQDCWLGRAEEEGWSSRDLQEAIRASRAVEATSHGAMHEPEDCDVVIGGLVAEIRERLPACGFSIKAVIEVSVSERGVEYRLRSGGDQ